MILLVSFLLAMAAAFAQTPINPGCEASQAWNSQLNPVSDPTGLINTDYPALSATSWVTILTPPQTATIHGTFPVARAMDLQVDAGLGAPGDKLKYLIDAGILDYLKDQNINPDPGQNNPFVSGAALGTYTVQAVWSDKPSSNPQPNTLYLGTNSSSVNLAYRVVYATDPNDLAADVPLPAITIGGAALVNCAVRPIITPQDATVWGRLVLDDFMGVRNYSQTATHPATWGLFPSSASDNAYMVATISRQFLVGGNSLVVVKLERPTSPDTRNGIPPYSPSQVRFWSIGSKEPLSTAAVRVVADWEAAVSGNSSVFVVSDPSEAPNAAVLSRWGATWIPWGALYPGDFLYNLQGRKLTNDDGVFWYGLVWYSQIFADPGFAESIENIAKLPASQQEAAMGAYWPSLGYCSLNSFTFYGAGCIGR